MSEQNNFKFEKEEYKKATEKAMSLLLVQDRTKKGLSDRLRQAGFSEEASEFAVSYVIRYGYVDDYRFASNYIQNRKETKSRRELQYKLMQKGVPQEAIAAAFEEYDRDDEYRSLCYRLNKKLKGRSIGDMDEREKKKLMSHLSAKGYPLTQIRNAMQKYVSE